jgi:phage baseplate assembly protein W
MSDALDSRDFLGRGWAFPIRAEEGAIASAEREEAIRQSVWLILATSPGERPMRPDFGCGMHDLVFAGTDASTAGSVASSVRDALLRWEPRIEVLDVEVTREPSAPTTLTVLVEYRVRSTNNVFNLVYPFYLEQAGAR